MNGQLKTVLLTVLTLSVFALAVVELSGVSKTALFNKYGIGKGPGSDPGIAPSEAEIRMRDASEMKKTEITFYETKFSFGEITEGDVVQHAFRFKNTGKEPLLISNAEASCGCTVPSFPKKPIPPGGEGEIVVQFNSNNRPGHQQKNVIVYSNAQMEKISIGFDAEVREK